jgi:TRAP-type C4-dicarboxylate transport system substrate-binding protein
LRRLAQALAQPLVGGGFARNVVLEEDVTAGGEKATELFASIERSERQIGYMASSYLSARVPALGALDLPFSVSDRHVALEALDGRAGALLREAIARDSGFHVLAFWDNGFRHLSNAVRPLRTPADCAGLVIRTLDNAHYRALFESLGFQAVTTDVKDLVRAVETGAVQAQENPLTNLISFGLWRHHPHVSLSGHCFGVLLLVCPRDWYEALPATRRVALDRAVREATTAQRQLAAEQDVSALAQLRSHGVQVLEAHEIDRAAMRVACTAVCASVQRGVPLAVLEAYLPEAVH